MVRWLLVASALGAVAGCAPHHDLSLPTKEEPAEQTKVPYPDGPYGITVGSVLADMGFEGYRADSDKWEPIALHDFYDPDGKKGIKALLLVSAVTWCPTCQLSSQSVLEPLYLANAPKGLRILHALREGGERGGDPATRTYVDLWKKKYGLTFDQVLDVDEKTLAIQGDASFTPFFWLVDTRTMRIVEISKNQPSPSTTKLRALLTQP